MNVCKCIRYLIFDLILNIFLVVLIYMTNCKREKRDGKYNSVQKIA